MVCKACVNVHPITPCDMTIWAQIKTLLEYSTVVDSAKIGFATKNVAVSLWGVVDSPWKRLHLEDRIKQCCDQSLIEACHQTIRIARRGVGMRGIKL